MSTKEKAVQAVEAGKDIPLYPTVALETEGFNKGPYLQRKSWLPLRGDWLPFQIKAKSYLKGELLG